MYSIEWFYGFFTAAVWDEAAATAAANSPNKEKARHFKCINISHIV